MNAFSQLRPVRVLAVLIFVAPLTLSAAASGPWTHTRPVGEVLTPRDAGAAANATLLPRSGGGPRAQFQQDICNFEGDSWSVGSAPLCDPYTECSVDRYTCSINARTGYFEGFHQTFCGACQPFSSMASPVPLNFGARLTGSTELAAAVVVSGGGLERVSVGAGNVQASGGASLTPALSDDGRLVAFDSGATNLVGSDTNGVHDVFVYDRDLAQVERISVATGGGQGNGHSIKAAISADGRYVAFLSRATNLVAGDTNGRGDVFVRDRQTGQTERVNLGPGGVEATGGSLFRWGLPVGSWPTTDGLDNTEVAISADGRHVAFVSDATNLVAGGTDGMPAVFVRDRQLGITELVSVVDPSEDYTGAQQSARPHVSISSDGRFVAYDSPYAAIATDTNDVADVFVRDRQTGLTSRVSVSSAGVQGNGYSGWPSISGDGRYVAFASDAGNLVAGDTNGNRDVFLYDRQTGQTSRVSTNTLSGFRDRAIAPAISRNGQWVTFARPLTGQIFLAHVQTGTMQIVSRANATSHANGATFGAAINSDGRVLAFAGAASNLVPGDSNGQDDVFVAAAGSMIYNGSFSAGAEYWSTYAPGSIVSDASGGLMQFYRTGFQAVVIQQTGAQLLSGVPLEAQFDLGNSSSARKRISVLLHDYDFLDLSVCTFWLAPNAPMRSYRMRTHTTKMWANAHISFYAATVGSDGGYYQIDNVSMQPSPAVATTRTDCVDPTAPLPPGGPASGNLLTNGDFSSGLAPWGLFGQIVQQIATGVFEFYRPAGAPSGVVLQASGDAMTAAQIMTATFDLGNSSSVRKRVTILLHEADFSDLTACTFWLPPGQALSTYAMRTFSTKTWTNATVSVYPSTIGLEQWTRLDNVSLQRTPATAILGTECVEPGAVVAPTPVVMRSGGLGTQSALRTVASPLRTPTLSARPADWAPNTRGGGSSVSATVPVWVPPSDASAEIQISADGVTWQTITTVEARDEWTLVAVDLSDFASQIVHLRFVFQPAPEP